MNDDQSRIEQKPPCPACAEQRVHTDAEWLNHLYHREEPVDERKDEA